MAARQPSAAAVQARRVEAEPGGAVQRLHREGVVQLNITPKFGNRTTLNATRLSGDITSAIWRVQTTLPQGFVTLQAFLAGVPVVTAVDSGGVLEWVEHEVTGLVTDGTPAGIGAARKHALVYGRSLFGHTHNCDIAAAESSDGASEARGPRGRRPPTTAIPSRFATFSMMMPTAPGVGMIGTGDQVMSFLEPGACAITCSMNSS